MGEKDYKIIPVGRAKDIRGQTFGRLTVLERVEKDNQNGSAYWLCRCSCGNKTVIRGDAFHKRNPTNSCGCAHRKDIVGEKFGRLEVLSDTGRTSWGSVIWRCRCVCGKLVEVSAVNLRSGATKSCGCLANEVAKKNGKATRLKIAGRKFGRLKAISPTQKKSGSQIIWECECDCGAKVWVAGANLKRGHTKSCGCLSAEYSGLRLKEMHRMGLFVYPSGEEHHNYNPDITDEDRMARRQPFDNKVGKWRNNVFARDDYTCNLCRQIGGTLNAHHLNSWDSFPEERFDIDNGITLCEDCHKAFHVEYGYGKNTKEQFEEFASNYKQALTG